MPKEPARVEAIASSRERRRSTRYPITGAIWFAWEAPDGQRHKSNGVSRNVGKEGAFVVCESVPPIGSPVELMVTLPTRSRDQGPVCLCGSGNVRHVQREDLRVIGFGVCVEFQLELPMSAELPH